MATPGQIVVTPGSGDTLIASPPDRRHSGHHVHGLTGDSRGDQTGKRYAIVGEGIAPSQRVDGHDQPERQAHEQRAPAERARWR